MREMSDLEHANPLASALGPDTAALVIWRVRLKLAARDPLELPAFAGSLVRGALGAALRQVSCTTGEPTCTGCPEIPICPYGYGFETPLPADSPDHGAGPFVPHPFVLSLDAPARLAPGDPFTIELALIGRGRFHLASFVEALRWLSRRGLSSRRGRFAIERVEDISPRGPRAILLPEQAAFLAEPTDWTLADLARPAAGTLTLTTLSPMRLLARGEPVAELDLSLLLRALFRRIGALARYHCGFEPRVDYRGLLEHARTRTRVVERRLVWKELPRYSARQKRRMVLGGLEGSLAFEGDLAPALPFLLLGELLQVGKGTSFGLGRYRLDGPGQPARPSTMT